MKKLRKTLTRRKIAHLVAHKLPRQLYNSHVENVLALLADEFIRHLTIVKKINIPNFCSFSIIKYKPRKFYNFKHRNIDLSRGNTLMKIKISRRLRSEILEHIDIIKTFLDGDNNE